MGEEHRSRFGLWLDHVQLSIPRGSEDACRAFWVGVLGLREVPKPPILAARGGLWLRGEALELHLGVEDEFRPARRAHPAFRVRDFDALAAALQASQIPLTWDEAVPGRRRFFCADNVGNRLEFVEAPPAGAS